MSEKEELWSQWVWTTVEELYSMGEQTKRALKWVQSCGFCLVICFKIGEITACVMLVGAIQLGGEIRWSLLLKIFG